MEESRRERKKRQTRRLLAETAIKLFGEQGYEQTTVAQIAATADVATKTFFNYFPSKEDVLFADDEERNVVPLRVIAERRPGEPVADLLTRVYDEMRTSYLADGVGPSDPAVMATYARLLMTVPALQARALHRAFKLQQEMASALLDAYPDELDEISAAAVVGAFAGAAQGAGLRSIELGQPEPEFWDAMRRAVAIGLYGLPEAEVHSQTQEPRAQ
ncbi:TetR family transcriptional regulator [Pseudonocardia acaciae]|uniref:TetR family transcriptional regulator n=1 Tax=Pseudonocardia acaciae TaxID=551276 RepID=UPI0006845B02|nr:TetR family transcriptional regulator [Pseudonocardia acaciae]